MNNVGLWIATFVVVFALVFAGLGLGKLTVDIVNAFQAERTACDPDHMEM